MILGGGGRILSLSIKPSSRCGSVGDGNYMRLILSFLEAAQLRFFVVRALLTQHHLLCGDYIARHLQLL